MKTNAKKSKKNKKNANQNANRNAKKLQTNANTCNKNSSFFLIFQDFRPGFLLKPFFWGPFFGHELHHEVELKPKLMVECKIKSPCHKPVCGSESHIRYGALEEVQGGPRIQL